MLHQSLCAPFFACVKNIGNLAAAVGVQAPTLTPKAHSGTVSYIIETAIPEGTKGYTNDTELLNSFNVTISIFLDVVKRFSDDILSKNVK